MRNHRLCHQSGVCRLHSSGALAWILVVSLYIALYRAESERLRGFSACTVVARDIAPLPELVWSSARVRGSRRRPPVASIDLASAVARVGRARNTLVRIRPPRVHRPHERLRQPPGVPRRGRGREQRRPRDRVPRASADRREECSRERGENQRGAAGEALERLRVGTSRADEKDGGAARGRGGDVGFAAEFAAAREELRAVERRYGPYD